MPERIIPSHFQNDNHPNTQYGRKMVRAMKNIIQKWRAKKAKLVTDNSVSEMLGTLSMYPQTARSHQT